MLEISSGGIVFIIQKQLVWKSCQLRRCPNIWMLTKTISSGKLIINFAAFQWSSDNIWNDFSLWIKYVYIMMFQRLNNSQCSGGTRVLHSWRNTKRRRQRERSWPQLLVNEEGIFMVNTFTKDQTFNTECYFKFVVLITGNV